ncbi:MAG: hypothetical protein NTW05_16525 [Pseudonocardiales bacterium]|jgi:zinc transporter, ZIP family|nr:hypothetical protein [Pseudonocardiales bacterium]
MSSTEERRAGGDDLAGRTALEAWREPTTSSRFPAWVLGTGLLALMAAVLAGLAVFGSAALPERTGPPIEELAVERVVLGPGTIALTLRNAGADPVQVAQVFVNDAYVDFTGGDDPIPRIASETVTLRAPWQGGSRARRPC